MGSKDHERAGGLKYDDNVAREERKKKIGFSGDSVTAFAACLL
jgi:hypothetical protein